MTSKTRRAHRPSPHSRVRLLAAPLAAGILAACGAPAGTSPTDPATSATPTPASVIKTRHIPGLGRVLVNADGYVLYMFPPDKRHKVTCTGACAGTWPPATVPTHTTPHAKPPAHQSMLGTVPNPNRKGGRVVTYNGWPLYTYLPDVKPGEVTGQALDLNGGYWYVLRPSGKPIKHPANDQGTRRR